MCLQLGHGAGPSKVRPVAEPLILVTTAATGGAAGAAKVGEECMMRLVCGGRDVVVDVIASQAALRW